jgi:hypothetical protein
MAQESIMLVVTSTATYQTAGVKEGGALLAKSTPFSTREGVRG